MGEVKKQVALMARASVLLAEAQRNSARTAEDVKTIRSELMLSVYKDPTKLGTGVNLNIANVESWYRVQAEYREAVIRNQEAEYDAGLMQNMMYTLAHRRSAIEILAKRSFGEEGDFALQEKVSHQYHTDVIHPRSPHVNRIREHANKKLMAKVKKTKKVKKDE